MSQYKKTTVVFPLRDNEVLLGMKKRGFGAGWWNGLGGKLELGETYADSSVRETHEEVGLNIEESDLNHAADIVFRFDGTVDVVTRAYLATSFTGEPIETDEMRPQWFALSDIPYDTMWPADREWLPQIIEQTAPLPLGFIIDFTADNQFVTLQRADPAEIKRYF